MGTINLGPLAIPPGPIVIIVAMLLSLAVGRWAAGSRKTNIEPILWMLLIATLIGARLIFVARYFDGYKTAPWSILDIRDGGFSRTASILLLVALGAWVAWRRKDVRKPLVFAVSAGIATWFVGMAIIKVDDARQVRLPQIQLARLEGGTVPLQSLTGKPMVVNLWASWCPPCRREMPVLRDAQATYPDIRFVFANQGEAADAVRQYLQTERLSLNNVLLDFKLQVGRQTGSMALPTTLFFNERGILVDRRIGELSAATLAQRIESLRMANQP